MTRAQERLGRALTRAIRALEFEVTLTDGQPMEVDLVDSGIGQVPRLEVRHPLVECRGVLWLVAVIALDPRPVLTYAVPAYRRTIELVLRRALFARAA